MANFVCKISCKRKIVTGCQREPKMKSLKVRFYQKVVVCSSYKQSDEPFFVPQFEI